MFCNLVKIENRILRFIDLILRFGAGVWIYYTYRKEPSGWKIWLPWLLLFLTPTVGGIHFISVYGGNEEESQ